MPTEAWIVLGFAALIFGAAAVFFAIMLRSLSRRNRKNSRPHDPYRSSMRKPD